MKFPTFVALAAAAALIFAQPHRDAHHLRCSLPKSEPVEAFIYLPGTTETVVVYELDGYPISEEEVRQGIQNGTLTWGDDGVLSTSIFNPSAMPTPKPIIPSGIESVSILTKNPPTVIISPSSSAQLDPKPSTESHPPSSNNYSPCPDCDKVFPNRKYPCSTFPIGYGAVPLSNEGLGGWTGIQEPRYQGVDGMDDIMTVPMGTCADGTCCTPGRFCSYGCPNPYLKMSFPKLQGKSKQSIGGLYCNENGKLEMAGGSLGNTLCGRGSQHAIVKVQNMLSQSVSICRTDYPGKLRHRPEGDTP